MGVTLRRGTEPSGDTEPPGLPQAFPDPVQPRNLCPRHSGNTPRLLVGVGSRPSDRLPFSSAHRETGPLRTDRSPTPHASPPSPWGPLKAPLRGPSPCGLNHPPISAAQPQTPQGLPVPVLPELSPLTVRRGEEGRALLTWVQMSCSVGSRGSAPHSPRYWLSRTRSPFRHAASAPPRKSSRPQPGGPWGRNPGQPSHSPGLCQDPRQSPHRRARLMALPLSMPSGEDPRPRICSVPLLCLGRSPPLT